MSAPPDLLSEAFDALAAAGQPWNGIRATGFQNHDAIDDQSLGRLNDEHPSWFESALLKTEDTVNPCGKLTGFVPQRRRWPKIS